MRIELTSRAWEARVIAIIRRPLNTGFTNDNSWSNIHKPKFGIQSYIPKKPTQ